ncbi:MAG: repeat containing protein [Bacillales bacterium]|jgi:DNA-binding beta-propeller fold protein YncE|nr:repeat containing protein [Bacillales bacterium]
MEQNSKFTKIKKIYVYAALATIVLLSTAYIVGNLIWGGKESEYTNKPLNIKMRKPGADPQFYFAISSKGENELLKPMDIYSDGKQVYVTDATKLKVFVYDEKDGNLIFSFGKAGNGKGQFAFPYGITADKEGNIYVADTDNNNISIFTPDGKFKNYFKPVSKEDAISSPSAIRIFDEKLYVPEIQTGRVKIFDLNGNKLFEIMIPSEQEQLNSPNGIAVDKDGNIYVSDTVNARIVKFDNTGKLAATFNGEGSTTASVMTSPRGIVVDKDGTIYDVDLVSQCIMKFDKNGKFLNKIGDVGSGNAQFRVPSGLFLGDNGSIYITDRMNQRIQLMK